MLVIKPIMLLELVGIFTGSREDGKYTFAILSYPFLVERALPA